MSAAESGQGAEIQQSVSDFNEGSIAATVETFASDVTFVVPGKSALAGTYQGRDKLAAFFAGLHELSGGSFQANVDEVLANDARAVLFLRFTAQRGDENLDVTMAGFHDDLGEDGWRKATFLVDDQESFDRFFQKN